jgi:SAM-dependent methyltransferase
MCCPLCSSRNTRTKESFEVSQILEAWAREQGIDVASEFGGLSSFELRACLSCGLEFFWPESIAGSSELYEKLEKIEGYYLPQKWEHDAALQDMGGARNGLEIGCGFGAFVERVAREMKIPFEGCEQNPSAVRTAQNRGLCVRLESLEDLARRNPGSYDAVCAFQVLEHVTNPGAFLSQACALLRPGGKLMIGVPNSDSYIKHMFQIFDAPPHHMTRWDKNTLTRLPRWFPVDLVRIALEPLPDYRTDWYLVVHESILRRYGLGPVMHPGIRSRVLRIIRHPKIRRFLKGDTIYGCYVRRG